MKTTIAFFSGAVVGLGIGYLLFAGIKSRPPKDPPMGVPGGTTVRIK